MERAVQIKKRLTCRIRSSIRFLQLPRPNDKRIHRGVVFSPPVGSCHWANPGEEM